MTDDPVRMTCDRCGVFWDGDFTDMTRVLEVLSVHRADSCHPQGDADALDRTD